MPNVGLRRLDWNLKLVSASLDYFFLLLGAITPYIVHLRYLKVFRHFAFTSSYTLSESKHGHLKNSPIKELVTYWHIEAI